MHWALVHPAALVPGSDWRRRENFTSTLMCPLVAFIFNISNLNKKWFFLEKSREANQMLISVLKVSQRVWARSIMCPLLSIYSTLVPFFSDWLAQTIRISRRVLKLGDRCLQIHITLSTKFHWCDFGCHYFGPTFPHVIKIPVEFDGSFDKLDVSKLVTCFAPQVGPKRIWQFFWRLETWEMEEHGHNHGASYSPTKTCWVCAVITFVSLPGLNHCLPTLYFLD